jgi:hypothetical protein
MFRGGDEEVWWGLDAAAAGLSATGKPEANGADS